MSEESKVFEFHWIEPKEFDKCAYCGESYNSPVHMFPQTEDSPENHPFQDPRAPARQFKQVPVETGHATAMMVKTNTVYYLKDGQSLPDPDGCLLIKGIGINPVEISSRLEDELEGGPLPEPEVRGEVEADELIDMVDAQLKSLVAAYGVHIPADRQGDPTFGHGFFNGLQKAREFTKKFLNDLLSPDPE